MGTVKREGKWRIEKKTQGVYIITERKERVAKLITGDYETEGVFDDERAEFAMDVEEVKDFNEVKKRFNEMIQ